MQQSQTFSLTELEMVVEWKKKIISRMDTLITAYITVPNLIQHSFNWETAPTEVVTTLASCVSIYLDLKGTRFARKASVFYKTSWCRWEEQRSFWAPHNVFIRAWIVKLVWTWSQCYWYLKWLEISLCYLMYHLIHVPHLPLEFNTLFLASTRTLVSCLEAIHEKA